MLTNLQGLRAVAAVCVMIFHFGLMPATRLPFMLGAVGVDLFFVLSGFIIAHSAARGTQHFLAHRLIRVIPAYWIATLIAALLTVPVMGVGGAAGWLGQSLLYLPGPGGRPALIFVGWTLLYELGFYLLYWLALRVGPTRAPFVALALLLALASLPIPGGFGPWPLLIEFAFGIGIFLATERGGVGSARAGVAVVAAGIALLLLLSWATGYNPDDFQRAGRVVAWGLPAAVIVLGLVVAERGGLRVRSGAVLRLGAASYAMYLLHPIVLGVLIALPPGAPSMGALYCLLAVGATIAISLLFHTTIEAPTVRRLRGLFGDRPPVEQAAAPAGIA